MPQPTAEPPSNAKSTKAQPANLNFPATRAAAAKPANPHSTVASAKAIAARAATVKAAAARAAAATTAAAKAAAAKQSLAKATAARASAGRALSAKASAPAMTPEATLLPKIQAQLATAMATVTQLQGEVRRLQAALAVERANEASKELKHARREKHLFNFRMSRIMRVFDILDLPRPNLEDEPSQFVNDTYLDDIQKRFHASSHPPQITVNLHHDQNPPPSPNHQTPAAAGRPPKRTRTSLETPHQPQDNPPLASDVSRPEKPSHPTSHPPDSSIATATHPGEQQPTTEPQPCNDPEHTNTTQHPFPQFANGTVPPAQLSPSGITIDESNPAAECLRILIGAESITVFDNPRRVRIKLRNPNKDREVVFSLSWEGGGIECVHESYHIEDSICPDFLLVEKIEFDSSQAPTFLVLLLGAIFDMKIEPKAEPEIEPEPERDDAEGDQAGDDEIVMI